MQSHGIEIARSHLKSLGDTVGSIVQAKEENWEYAVPELDKPVSSVAVGLDGTCMLLAEDGWREAMVGTLSLYDRQGERQHTIQIGATPEYGKQRFLARLDQELARIKSEVHFIFLVEINHNPLIYAVFLCFGSFLCVTTLT